MNVPKLRKEELDLLTSGLKENEEIIEEEAAIGWDGRNLIIRLPKDIAVFLGLSEKNRFKKNIKFMIQHNLEGQVVKEFDIVDRKSPKKEVKEDGSQDNEKR